MGKADKERMRKKKERQQKENEASANNPATHRCGCSKADGRAMMLDECMAGESRCALKGKRWECGAPFQREHIRHGDPTAPLYLRCFKHRSAQIASPASLAGKKATDAVRDKKKQGTAKESERQKTRKAKQRNRIRPTGNLRTLLRRLRPTFKEILAKSAQGKLFVTTMKTIDCFLEKPVNEQDCAVACFDVELMSSDGETGLPVWTGLFQIGTACTPVQAKTSPRAGFAAMSGIGQVGSW
jgi:hypothetical protein